MDSKCDDLCRQSESGKTDHLGVAVEKRMKDARTGGKLSGERETRTDWSRLRDVNDIQIRKGIDADVNATPTDADFWKNAKVVWPARKAVVTMRLDRDLLDWFRQQRGAKLPHHQH